MRSPWPRLNVVITAGPTREYLDDVRFLSNASTGRMGVALARAAARRGAQVTLVLGPVALTPPRGVRTVPVLSTADMLAATRAASAGADLVLFAAAPADWRPAQKRRGKPAREAGAFDLRLRPTVDVAAALGRRKGRRLHVGFALEVAPGEARARAKLEQKHLDAIVLNSPENLGPGGGRAWWIEGGAAGRQLPTRSKALLAGRILEEIADLRRRRAADDDAR